MKLSIIIVSWNVKELLRSCLESIYAHPPKDNIEVWVVDNNSTDGSPAMVRTKFPQVNLIVNPTNRGFAGGNNQALEKSTGDYALLLNPDTRMLPETLEHFTNFLDFHSKAGAVGAKLLNPDGSHQPDSYPFPTLSRELWRLLHLDMIQALGVYDQSQWDQHQPRQVDVLQGTALAVRREALNQVGLLDTGYFMYTEEVDLCYRLHQAGWNLYWLPQAQVVHYGGQSTQQIPEEMFLHLYQSKLRFFRKHHGDRAAVIYKLILVMTSLPRLLLRPLAKLQHGDQRQKNLALAKNYRRLLASLREM